MRCTARIDRRDDYAGAFVARLRERLPGRNASRAHVRMAKAARVVRMGLIVRSSGRKAHEAAFGRTAPHMCDTGRIAVFSQP